MKRLHISCLVLSLAVVAAATGGAQTTESPAQLLSKVDERLLAWDAAGARAFLDKLPDRDTVPARIATGRLLAQEKKFDEAIAKLSSVSQAAPSNPEPALQLGEAYLLAARADEARAAFTQAVQRAEAGLRSTPANVGLLLTLGTARQRLRQIPEATTALQQALQLAPGNAKVAYQLGVTRALASDWSKAVEHLTAAVQGNAELAHAYFYRALAAEKIGRKDLLINDLERFLALAPGAPEAPRAQRLLQAIRG